MDFTSFTATAYGSVLPLSVDHGLVSDILISPTRSENIIGTISGVAATLNTANETKPTGTGISRNRESGTDVTTGTEDLISDRMAGLTADPMADRTAGLISDRMADHRQDRTLP